MEDLVEHRIENKKIINSEDIDTALPADIFFYPTYLQVNPQSEIIKHVNVEDHMHFIATQGQIVTAFPESLNYSDELSRVNKTGYGFFAWIPIKLKGKYFILSCAHHFKSLNQRQGRSDNPESATFLFKPVTKEKKLKLLSTKTQNPISNFYFHPSYFRKSFLIDYYNGLVLAICDISLKDCWRPKNISLANVNIAKKGDEICIFGGERYKNVYACMVANIADIVYKTEEEAMIVYKNINTTPEMSGSPVYIRQDNDSWAIIGVHVVYDEIHDCNVAVGLTNSKLEWIHQTAQEYANEATE